MVRVGWSETGGAAIAEADADIVRSAHRPGSVKAALANRDFRTLWIGQTVSSIGTWMQNLAVGPYALALSKSVTHPHGSASFVALVSICQMAPMLLLAMIGGVLANRVSRRRLILSGQGVQLVAASALALLAVTHASKTGLVVCVLASGIANALSAPTYQSVIPEVVGFDNMPGAISLNSASLNGSRVVGPLILLAMAAFGVRTSTAHGMAIVFGVNALTFLASMAAVALIVIPAASLAGASRGAAQLLDGVREARRNPVVGRALLVLFLLSLLCLPYISHFPSIAERSLGVDSNSTTYKVLFGVWALGAMLGSLAQATVLVAFDKRRTTRWMLVGFGLSLLAFSTARSVSIAFPIVLVLGFCYFGSTTAMSTVMQQHLASNRRGPVMALWMMAFGGTIPFGSAWGGRVIDRFSPTPMLVIGGVVGLGLAWAANFVTLSERVRR
jgi:MFS family permease